MATFRGRHQSSFDRFEICILIELRLFEQDRDHAMSLDFLCAGSENP
jgi:hypothetical protein